MENDDQFKIISFEEKYLRTLKEVIRIGWGESHTH